MDEKKPTAPPSHTTLNQLAQAFDHAGRTQPEVRTDCEAAHKAILQTIDVCKALKLDERGFAACWTHVAIQMGVLAGIAHLKP